MLVDELVPDVAEDVVQQEPGDLIPGVRLDADVEVAAVDAEVEDAVGDGVVRAELDVGADAQPGVLEAEGHDAAGDGAPGEVVGEDDIALV